jgi:hypothetical protein
MSHYPFFTCSAHVEFFASDSNLGRPLGECRKVKRLTRVGGEGLHLHIGASGWVRGKSLGCFLLSLPNNVRTSLLAHPDLVNPSRSDIDAIAYGVCRLRLALAGVVGVGDCQVP